MLATTEWVNVCIYIYIYIYTLYLHIPGGSLLTLIDMIGINILFSFVSSCQGDATSFNKPPSVAPFAIFQDENDKENCR